MIYNIVDSLRAVTIGKTISYIKDGKIIVDKIIDIHTNGNIWLLHSDDPILAGSIVVE